jgi:superfamily I DNA/RNA helicase
MLTAEQRQPLDLAKGPVKPVGGQHPLRSSPEVIATVAGPGSGKTTMQEHLAVNLRQKGHKKLLKLYFNKSAAVDGERRLNDVLTHNSIPIGDPEDPHVLCKTTHSAALRVAKEPMRGQTPREIVDCAVDEAQLQKIILKDFAHQISVFHGEAPESAPAGAARDKARLDVAKKEKLIGFWIFKSFVNWLASRRTEQELQKLKTDVERNPRAFDSITYFPAKKGHREKLPQSSPSGPGSWYLERVHELWQRMCNDPTCKIVHDCYLKWAQLKGCRLENFSALLLDEAQDLNECQLDLFVVQPASHADIYIVGDMAQALYAWRHAAPKELASLGRKKPGLHSNEDRRWFYTLHGQLSKKNRKVTVTKLTQTFRFGEPIARIANAVLHVKEHSDQTGEGNTLWVPYRVVGRPGTGGTVTEEPLSFPKTIVGRTNLGLAMAGWRLLEQDADVKIALNGDGDGAGRNKFATVFKELKAALRLFHCNQDSSVLPVEVREAQHASFEEFENWEDFKKQVEERELNQFNIHVNLCHMHGEPAERPELLDMIENFQESIIGKAYDKDECDVLLSTVCQAKGLEWPRVEVLGDCIDLSVLGDSSNGGLVFAPNYNGGERSKKDRPDYKGDEVNSWFVAVTRAQEELRLPQKWYDLVEFARTVEPTTPGQIEMWEGLNAEAQATGADLLNGLCNELGITQEVVGTGEEEEEVEEEVQEGAGEVADADADADDEQQQGAMQSTVTQHYRSKRNRPTDEDGQDQDGRQSPSKKLKLDD